MSYFKRRVLPFAAGLAFAVSATVPSAATVVNVELWDKGADMEMAKGLVYGAPGVDMSKATMGMRLVACGQSLTLLSRYSPKEMKGRARLSARPPL